jgi:hypothetical protein
MKLKILNKKEKKQMNKYKFTESSELILFASCPGTGIFDWSFPSVPVPSQVGMLGCVAMDAAPLCWTA